MHILAFSFFTIVMLGFAGTVEAAGDAAKGEKIYKTKCMVCHAIDTNKVGPISRGTIGRKAGSVAGFNYSAALKATGLIWDEANLDKWLTAPSDVAKGTKMVFRLPQAQERADVIAYLKTLTAK